MHDRERRTESAEKPRFPKISEYVVAAVRDVCDGIATVDLLEYRGVVGYVPQRELWKSGKQKGHARNRNRSTHYMLEVVSVSKQGCYVELTKKGLDSDKEQECTLKYKQRSFADKTMVIISMKLGCPSDTLYETFGRVLREKYGSLYFGMVAVSAGTESLADVAGDTMAVVRECIRKRFAPKSRKYVAVFDVACFSESGVRAVRDALVRAENTCAEVSISLLSSPRFAAAVTSKDGEHARAVLQRALDTVRTEIAGCGGTYTLVQPPESVETSAAADLSASLRSLVI